jgi:hypothetical protein
MSVFYSIWGVVDVVNNSENLKIRFPNHQEQKRIAQGFKKMSGAGFDKVIGAIDGILIWVIKPSKAECKRLKCGEKSFYCSRKGKFGVNMQGICDDKLRFTWLDISWPGSTADYMAWVTSDLYADIENPLKRIILTGFTLLGDNAYVKSSSMSVPFKGTVQEDKDSYNFYQSQLRITIERAFGVLVHRWAILRGPLLMPIGKVAPFVNCLCCLHNFCINRNIVIHKARERVDQMMEVDAFNVALSVECINEHDSDIRGVNVTNEMVTISNECRPTSLLGGGEHFSECPKKRENITTIGNTPMDVMFNMIKDKGLLRPLVHD